MERIALIRVKCNPEITVEIKPVRPRPRVEKRFLAHAIKPTDTIPYVDRVHFRLKTPLVKKEISWLRKQCGHLHIPKKWCGAQLQLAQPSKEALQRLETIVDTNINYVEMSLDWIFSHETDRDDAFSFVDRNHVKKYHRDQDIRFFKGTRYSGPRRAPTVLAIYHDKPSKVTGETNCVHFDWRIRGVDAVRRAGVASINGLLNLDYYQFWKARLLMRAINGPILGRMLCNQRNGTRRQTWVGVSSCGYRYDHHASAGGSIIEACGSTQAVIDDWGRWIPRIHKAFIPIDVDHLLPSSQSDPFFSYDYGTS